MCSPLFHRAVPHRLEREQLSEPLAGQKVGRRAFLRGVVVLTSGVAFGACGDSTQPFLTHTATDQPGPAPSTVARAASPSARVGSSWSPVVQTNPPSPRRDHSLTFNSGDGLIYAFGGRA